MNNTFSLQRFGWLMKKTLVEKPFQTLGIPGLALAISLIVYFFMKTTGNIDDAQNASFFIGLVGGGAFLASFMFNYFYSNAIGSSFLSLPASQFEKWLCGILITGVFFVSIFLLCFRLMDTAFVNSYHHNLDPLSPFYKDQYEAVKIFPYDSFVADKSFLLFFNITGSMFLAALYFNKAAFIKGALLFIGVWAGFFLLNIFIASIFFDVKNAIPYFLVWIQRGSETGRLELSANIQNIVTILFHYILPAILWSLAYLRLREKEF